MKTEEIIMLDCTKKGNREILNKFLWKVKPCARILEKNNCVRTEMAPIELLEQVLHGLCERYSYKMQQIWTYEEKGKFKFYHMGVIRVTDTHEWLGDVNGITLWEVISKAIIKVYADLKREKT